MNKTTFTKHLKAFDFETLFNQLGWDHFDNRLPVGADDHVFELRGVVEKKGFVILLCPPDANGNIPLGAIRKQIERKVAKIYFEHLIIYEDQDQNRQIWQIAVREPGRPKRIREISYYVRQDAEVLFQRLRGLLFTLDEEEGITLVDVKARVMENFAKNAEKVTKKFYAEFKTHHTAFLRFIEGIDDIIPEKDNKNKHWYASLMLNRLMFCYFIQKKGYLDRDNDYLQNKLKATRKASGEDRFHDFYRVFLIQLFHQGLGRPEDKRETTVDLGRIPYLNGGLFDVHELETQFGNIRIKDDAFERIFDFFDEWNWHLDNRIEASGRDINPDVIGYIFEKYINDRAAMGAYYTKEDITEYIGKNCIVPFLFDEVRRHCPAPFKPDGEIWQWLKNSGDAYVYDAVKKGVELELPEHIAIGLDTSGPGLLERRKDWNAKTPEEYALPTEIWRETIERRKRHAEVKTKIETGEISEINDFVTHNLNIRQFVQDVIEHTGDAQLVRHFYKAVRSITVLDPTCGSGAFLFAALNILEPIYEGCIERMEQFVDENPKAHKFFCEALKEINSSAHPNRQYFVFKSIVLNNLYGVDIMKEAVEIAKLRLFLKMVAAVDFNPKKPNYGLEPLPDIDFNIRSGNTLVGFANETDLMTAIEKREGMLLALEKLPGFKEQCELVSQEFTRFKDVQLIEDMNSDRFGAAKKELGKRLYDLNEKMNSYLASVYDIDAKKEKEKYGEWLASHQPFNWFAEFYHIVAGKGGFDVIIGNPPYVVYSPSKIQYQIKEISYQTFPTKNIYAFVFERSTNLVNDHSPIGLIVQLTAISSHRLASLQDLLITRGNLFATPFPRRPESMFDGVEMPVVILLSIPKAFKMFVTSRIGRIYKEERPTIITSNRMTQHEIRIDGYRIAKFGGAVEKQIYDKIFSQQYKVANLIKNQSKHFIYYQEACRYWVKSVDGIPFFQRNGEKLSPPHGRYIYLSSQEASAFLFSLMNSCLFFWYYSIFSDCEHINDQFVKTMPIPKNWDSVLWTDLAQRLSQSLNIHSNRKTITTKQGHKIEYDETKAMRSKMNIDSVDLELAKLYGFTEEELDFIINYDIKYRMGDELENEPAQERTI